jgi:glutamine amidotransferase
MIGIIDYGAGNLFSVRKALDYLGLANSIIRNAGEIFACDRLLLPGVGHFGNAMERLRAAAMVPALRDWLTADRPFLGICLGMQMLFCASDEAPGINGLGFFAGQSSPYACRPRLQIGWNRVHAARSSAIWKNATVEYHYYVNGYHVVPADRNIVAATSDYGGEFTAAVQCGRIWGVQFHPEKSAACGLDLLRRWGTS